MVHFSKGTLDGHIQTVNNVFSVGLIRGLASMGLGYFIHEFYQYIKTQPFVKSIKSVLTYTIIEGYLLGFVIYETALHKMSFNNKIIIVIAFVGLFLTFLLKRGFVSNFLNTRFSAILGRYAFAIYMTHFFILDIANNLWFKTHIESLRQYPLLNIFIPLVIVLIFAVFTYHFVEVPAGNYLKKKFFPEKV